MILNDRARFAFVHIPKCAGTTVRRALEPFDDFAPQVSEAFKEHPHRKEVIDIDGLGYLDSHHLPLDALAKAMPDALRRLREFTTVGIVREPHDRLFSAFSEYVKQNHGTSLQTLSQPDVRHLFDDTLRRAADHMTTRAIGSFEFIHFQPQSDFVFLGDERIVKYLFPIDQMEACQVFITRIFAKHGIAISDFESERANRSIVHRNEATRIVIESARPLVNIIRTGLPAKVRAIMHDAVYVDRDKRFGELARSQSARDFVARFYAKDLVLWNQVRFPPSGSHAP